jgi:hypothetical protein
MAGIVALGPVNAKLTLDAIDSPNNARRFQSCLPSAPAFKNRLPELIAPGTNIQAQRLEGTMLLHTQRCGSPVCVNSASNASMVGRLPSSCSGNCSKW